MVIILLTGGRIWDDLFAFFSYFWTPHSLMPHTNILVILGRNIKEIIISLAPLVLSKKANSFSKKEKLENTRQNKRTKSEWNHHSNTQRLTLSTSGLLVNCQPSDRSIFCYTFIFSVKWDLCPITYCLRADVRKHISTPFLIAAFHLSISPQFAQSTPSWWTVRSPIFS